MTPGEAKKILIEELQWPEYMVELGIHAKFSCEYCGKYLLESIEVYDLWQIDHIVPNKDDDPSNLAVACKTCNFIKRHTDPSSTTKGLGRETLIEAAKSIIEKRRKAKQKIFDRTKEAVEILRNEERNEGQT